MSDEEHQDAAETESAASRSTEAADAEPAAKLKKAKKKARSDRREASASWGFPRFAKDFPKTPELDLLVAAFARGDYATVRAHAPKLAAETEDEDVRRAARTLRERIEPDPTARMLFLIAAALLVFLTGWWVAHDGPDGNGAPPKTAPR